MQLKYISIFTIAMLFLACGDGKTSSAKTSEVLDKITSSEGQTATISEQKTVDATLCASFPKDIVLQYNKDALQLDIEAKSYASETSMYCDLKLFYGKKDYEFWKGQIGAYVSQQSNPFFQYNPKRNPALYHKVDGLGEQAVFITNMNQLLVLKDGIVYDIVPPNHGATTNSGKANKEIAIAIAKHYKL